MLKQIITLISLFICLVNPASALSVSAENYNAAIEYTNSHMCHGILTCSDSSDFSSGTYMYVFQIVEGHDRLYIVLTDPISGYEFAIKLDCLVNNKYVHFYDCIEGSPNYPAQNISGLKTNSGSWLQSNYEEGF
jgi:hypothetical protein